MSVYGARPGCLCSSAEKPLMLTHVLAAVTALATPSPEDSANIALATAIVQQVGDSIWPGWQSTPFRIDLITANGPAEINFKAPEPAPSFPPTLEAMFPWPDGVPTIAIGEPQFVQARTPTRWTVTLLHEHFHQWQDAWPQYFPAVNGLGLSSPGDSGMWMLDYPFPYANSKVVSQYAALSGLLADAISSPGVTAKGAAFAQALNAFSASLQDKDRRYFAFQCWQEGVARYTEYAAAHAAADAHTRDPDFLTDSQAALLAADAESTYAKVLRELRDPSALGRDKRDAFYAFGAGEAMLLDEMNPGWHSKYLDPRMNLALLF